jgi:hypothetical protein
MFESFRKKVSHHVSKNECSKSFSMTKLRFQKLARSKSTSKFNPGSLKSQLHVKDFEKLILCPSFDPRFVATMFKRNESEFPEDFR